MLYKKKKYNLIKDKTMKKLLLIICALSIQGCSMTSRKFGPIDTIKLHDNSQKYGVILIRAMYFSKAKNNDEYLNLQGSYSSWNNITFFASRINENNDIIRGTSVQITDNVPNSGHEINLDFLKPNIDNTIVDGKAKDYSIYYSKKDNLTWYQAKAFYSLRMLPEGSYCVTSYDLNNKNYYGNFNCNKAEEATIKFNVKAGQVNYLGDFYLDGLNETNRFFYSYDISINRIDNFKHARRFYKQHYSNINLPIVNVSTEFSLIHGDDE
jgi:hypothetical protein